MSFKDFEEFGPGTFGWDFVLGDNTTGIYPDETYYEEDGETVTKVTLTHVGGGRYEPVRVETYETGPDKDDDK